MQYDLVIRNGVVIDGTGLPRWRADVGVRHGRIAALGRISDKGRQEIDAEGHVVTPGFVDGHTHMDAQIMWDGLGECSVYHGVTSVVMGNCGFTLAPARSHERPLVVRNLERAEDISAEAMAQGITWSWETFPEYLDTLERVPKGINYAGYVGHSALRTFAMGERAFEAEATPDDLAVMARELRDSLRAGAIGFSTSRTINHATSDDRPVASRLAAWDEVRALVGVMGDLGAGIFEIASEQAARTRDPEVRGEYFGRIRDLAVETGRPVTFGVIVTRPDGSDSQWLLDLIDETAAAGGRMFGQAHAREFSVLLSWKTRLPFDGLAEWAEVRGRPLEDQKRAFTDPETRAWLVKAAHEGQYGRGIGAETRAPRYDEIMIMDRTTPPWRSVAEVAAERGLDPVELMIDLAVNSDFDQLFMQVIANWNQDALLATMRHPRTVVTFSDSGAHVSQIMDSSIQTHLLSHWVRDRQAFSLEEAVRMLTLEPASAWGFQDRGLLRVGMAADLNVFDPERVAPAMPTVRHDLPGGSRRLVQKAVGFKATVVNGEVLLRDGEPTGAAPGQLLRGPLARR
ncbi:MAG: N-acyl-D-amino-acid deacylase family protein [Acidimicrobiales bacterium]